MMRKRRRRYLILGLILGALPVLYLFEERVRGEWLLANYREELLARGEKLTIEELAPPIPEGTNVVLLTPAEAESMLNIGGGVRDEFPSTARTLSPGRLVASWQRDRWFDPDGRTCTWDDYLRAAAGTLDRLPELRWRLTNRVLRVTLDYGEGFTLLLPHLAPFKSVAQALCQAAIYDLHTGNLNGAAENLHAVASLTDLLEHEPLLIDQLVRVAIAAIARGTIWEALQADDWTDAQLALLQSDWARMRFTPTMVQALDMERAMNLTYFPGGHNFSRKLLRDSLSWSFGGLGGGGSGASLTGGGLDQWIEALGEAVQPLLLTARIEVWRHVWATHDQRFLLAATQEIIDIARDAMEHQRLRSVFNLADPARGLPVHPLLASKLEDRSSRRQRYLLSAQFLSATSKIIQKPALADAWNRVMVTAIALKRFHLKHGSWPGGLAALVPEFLPEIPIDWMDGQPLRYQLRDDGTYLLYSVGGDGIDQGGSPETTVKGSIRWLLGKDFVWPQPATPEEVDAADAEIAAKAAVKAARLGVPVGSLTEAEMMKRYGLIRPESDDSASHQSVPAQQGDE